MNPSTTIYDEMEELSILESFRNNFYSVSTMQHSVHKINEEMISSSLIASVLYNLFTGSTDTTYINNCCSILTKKRVLNEYSQRILYYTSIYCSLLKNEMKNVNENLEIIQESEDEEICPMSEDEDEKEDNKNQLGWMLIQNILEYMNTVETDQYAVVVFRDLLFEIQCSSYYQNHCIVSNSSRKLETLKLLVE